MIQHAGMRAMDIQQGRDEAIQKMSDMKRQEDTAVMMAEQGREQGMQEGNMMGREQGQAEGYEARMTEEAGLGSYGDQEVAADRQISEQVAEMIISQVKQGMSPQEAMQSAGAQVAESMEPEAVQSVMNGAMQLASRQLDEMQKTGQLQMENPEPQGNPDAGAQGAMGQAGLA